MERLALHTRALQRIGNVLECEGDYPSSFTALNRALAHAGTTAQRASILNDMGWVSMQQGNLDSAQTYCSQALALCNDESHASLRAQILDHLGNFHEKRGDVTSALHFHNESIAIKRSHGNNLGVAESYSNIGLAHHMRGDYSAALKSYKQSLAICKQVGYALGIAMAILNIGTVYADKDENSQAIEAFEDALSQFKTIQHRQGMAMCLDNLATCYENQSDLERALDYLNQAIDAYESLGDLEGQARGHLGRAQTMIGSDQPPQGLVDSALQEVEEAMRLAQQANAIEEVAAAHAMRARILYKRQDCETALSEFSRAIDLLNSIGNKAAAQDLEEERRIFLAGQT